MEPFALRTPRFVLNQPTAADVDDIAQYCTDPVFEHYMTTPWPYRREHAEGFVSEYVTGGWQRGDECTWAIRDGERAPLLGVIGIRLPSGMIGYWLGAPHRGRGIMTEAVAAVTEAAFDRAGLDVVRWECVVGNEASRRVAEKAGFTMTGTGPGEVLARDGSVTLSWTGELRRPGSDVI